MDRFTAKESSTLIEALQLMFPQSSTNKLRKMLSGSRVSVNGEIQHRAKHEIAQGDEVALGTKAMETVPKNKRPPTHDPRLKILFEDEWPWVGMERDRQTEKQKRCFYHNRGLLVYLFRVL